MAFLVCLLFRESIGVAITKSFVIFGRKFFASSTCGAKLSRLSFYQNLQKYLSRINPNFQLLVEKVKPN